MFGYSGKNQHLHFYRYPGRLEDCPVARTQGRKVTLIGNDSFRQARALHAPGDAFFGFAVVERQCQSLSPQPTLGGSLWWHFGRCTIAC